MNIRLVGIFIILISLLCLVLLIILGKYSLRKLQDHQTSSESTIAIPSSSPNDSQLNLNRPPQYGQTCGKENSCPEGFVCQKVNNCEVGPNTECTNISYICVKAETK